MVGSSSNHLEIRVLRQRLQGPKKRFNTIDEAKARLRPSDFKEALGWISRQGGLEDQVFPGLRRHDASDLFRYRTLSAVSLGREYRWAVAILELRRSAIEAILEGRARVEAAVAAAQFDTAIAELALMRERQGDSFWNIATELACRQMRGGVEDQKEFSKAILATLQPTSMAAWIVHQCSVRNEPSTSPRRFLQQVSTSIASWPLADEFKNVARYFVLGIGATSAQECNNILRYAALSSLEDYYDAWVHLLRSSVAERNDAFLPIRTKEIRDSALRGLPEVEALLTALDWAPDGNTNQTIQPTQRDLGRSLMMAVSIIQRARASAQCNDATAGIPGRLCEHAVSLFKRSSFADTSSDDIIGASLNWPRLVGTAVLDLARRHEESSQPPGIELALSSSLNRERDEVAKHSRYCLAILTSTLGLPAEYRIDAPWLHLEPATSAADDSDPLGATVNFVETQHQQRISRVRDGTAVAVEEILCGEEVSFSSASAKRLLAYALLRDGRTEELVQFVALWLVQQPSIQGILPIREIADAITPDLRRTLLGEPMIAILLDAYASKHDGAYDQHLRRAIKEVLLKHGNGKAADVAATLGGIEEPDRSIIAQFLRRLCLPEANHATGRYRDTVELIEDRIEVLDKLIEMSPEGDVLDQLKEEKLERTRFLVRRSRRAQIEQSRIQLDVEALRRDAEIKLGEAYRRYVDYCRAGMSRSAGVSSSPSSVRLSGEGAEVPVRVPVDEARELFKGMVLELRDAFANSPKYGLNGYLSTRIRHAVLENELRSALVSRELVTPWSRELDAYRENSRWVQPIQASNEPLAAHVGKALSEMSSQYDKLILEIKSEWIQVSTSAEQIGLIDLSLSEEWVGILEAEFSEGEIPLDFFVNVVFSGLVARLEPALAKIRAKMLSEGMQRAREIVQSAERTVSALRGEDSLVADLQNALREADIEIQRSFERVVSWFSLSYATASEPLPISEIVEIARDITVRFYSTFSLTSEVLPAADISVPGAFVSFLTDAFLLVFDNVIRHADLSPLPTVSLSITGDEREATVAVANAISQRAQSEDAQERVRAIVAAIAGAESLKSLVREGGTGLHKLAFYASQTGAQPNVRADFRNGMFVLEFQLRSQHD